MKISYRTHPVLGFLNQQRITGIVINDEMRSEFEPRQDAIFQNWRVNAHKFSSNLMYITKPFEEAYLMNAHKLNTKEIFYSVPSQSGTIIIGKWSFSYDIINIEDDLSFNIYAFQGDLLTFAIKQDLGNVPPAIEYWDINNTHNAGELAADVFLLLNFIRFCPLDIKFLPAKGRVKDIACKYVNDTVCSIKVLDSTWFTTLVKSEGFKVRGHFRLQPKKDEVGSWTKELIWISDFEKTGYTAPARKLSATSAGSATVDLGEVTNMKITPDSEYFK